MTTTTDMIESHLAWMRAGGYARNTSDDARKLLYRCDTDLPAGLPIATGDELATFLATDGWSTQTRATYRQHLCRFYAWGVQDGWIDFDPSTGLRRPRVPAGLPRPATDEQVAACLDRAADPWRLHCVLAAYAGMRSFEIAAAGRDDFTQRRIRVHGKGGKVRLVPTDPYVWQAIAPLPAGPVAGSRDADWVSIRTAGYLRRRLHIPVSLHMLRHWYATTTLRVHRNLRVVQKLLGHSSPSTTAVYTEVTDEEMAEAVAGLPRLAGQQPVTGAGPRAGAPPAPPARHRR